MLRRVLGLPNGRSGVVWRFPRRDGAEVLKGEVHCHDALQVVLVTAGTCVYEVGGERFNLQARSLLWLPPELEHVIIDYTPDFSMWLIGVSSQVSAQMKSRIPIVAGKGPALGMTRVLPAKCARTLNNIAQELSTGFQPIDGYEYGIAWWLASAWSAFAYGDSRDAKALHPGVSRAISFLLHDPSRDLTALARKAGISPSQLSRRFKRQVGMSISDFRNHVRLETFLRIRPRHKQKGLIGIAKEAGFGSYAQFNRAFRRELGLSPEEYYHSPGKSASILRNPSTTRRQSVEEPSD